MVHIIIGQSHIQLRLSHLSLSGDCLTRRKPTFPGVPRLRKCAGHFRTCEGFCTVHWLNIRKFSLYCTESFTSPEMSCTFPKAWNSRKCRFSSSGYLVNFPTLCSIHSGYYRAVTSALPSPCSEQQRNYDILV